MKKLRRLITLILALVVVFSCVACNGDDEIQKPTVEKMNYTGVHQFDATDIEGKYLVKDGQTEYTLVYPQERDDLGLLSIARAEFLNFFKKATNVSLPATTDAGLTHSASNKYISLGDTTLLREAVIEDPSVLNDELNYQGLKITTVDDTIFIYGANSFGALYGVYAFMEMEFNFDFYYTTAYEIDTDVNEIPLRNYDVKDVPDIRLRCPSYGYLSLGVTGSTDDEKYDSHRARSSWSWNRWILQIHREFDNINSSRENCHGVYTFTHPDDYADHGAWFAGPQPCFTAHGDEEEYTLMVQEYAKKIQNALKLYPISEEPLTQSVHIGIMDGGGHCSCDTCLQVSSIFTTSKEGGAPSGSNSAAVIMFVNQVAKEVKYWMNYTPEDGEPLAWWDDYDGGLDVDGRYCQDEWRRPDLEFTFFAYGDYNDCPAEWNESKGLYEAITTNAVPANLMYLTKDINDATNATPTGTLSAEMRQDVGTWYCYPANGTDSFYAENEVPGTYNQARERMKMWGDLTDVIWIWGYSTNFSNYSVMSNYYAAYGDELHQAMQAAGVVGLFNQGANLDNATSAFHLLKAYLNSKLSWNATYDQYELTKKFFKAMYGEGWQEMYQFFEDYRTFVVEGPTLDLNFNEMKQQSYPQVLVDSWLKLCEKAIEKNAKLKETDKAAYERIVNHIEIEFVSPAWMAISWYESSYSVEEMNEIKARMKRAVLNNGISGTKEHAEDAMYDFVNNF